MLHLAWTATWSRLREAQPKTTLLEISLELLGSTCMILIMNAFWSLLVLWGGSCSCVHLFWTATWSRLREAQPKTTLLEIRLELLGSTCMALILSGAFRFIARPGLQAMGSWMVPFGFFGAALEPPFSQDIF